MMKMTLERNEATLKLVEMEQGKLVARCTELEHEASSLRQTLDIANQTRQAALDERGKVYSHHNTMLVSH